MASISLAKVEREIEQIIKVTILQYANRIFNEAMSILGNPKLVGTYDLVVTENGYKVEITTSSNISAYIEFGTGNQNFRELLSRYSGLERPEVIESAIQFYVNGQGTMAARPYLFPTYFKYRDKIVPEINNRIQKYFDRVKL